MLQTSLLKQTVDWSKGTRCHVMQLGEMRDRKSPPVVQGQSSGSWSGRLHPSEAEAFFTFAHNILHFLPYARFFAGQMGEDGPMVNTL